jgi:anti-anti-sigma factor
MAREFIQSESVGPNGWTIWKVVGRIDVQTAQAACEKGEEIVKKSEKTALDMTEVEYISSAGIRVLLKMRSLAKELNHQYTVFGAKGTTKDILEESGMNALLPLKNSAEELE